MTREDQRKLKAIDTDLLRVSLMLDNVIRQRAEIDPLGTETYLEEMVKMQKKSVARIAAEQGIVQGIAAQRAVSKKGGKKI